MKSDYKKIFQFKIGELIEVTFSYSHLRPIQFKLFAPGGLTYWNFFFFKFLLSFHKAPF